MVNVIRYSLEQKCDHLRAVHIRPGPLGKFAYHALNLGGKVLGIEAAKNNLAHVTISIDHTLVDQFEEESGFGLQK